MPLHPLISSRRSIRAFDPAAEVTSEELAGILEAARWAPSSFNSQPWRFVVGRRDDSAYEQIFGALAAHNQRWARLAPMLLVAAHATHTAEGKELAHAAYDLGQAVAHLTVQATACGLYVHQMAGFDGDALRAKLALPDRVRPVTVIAVGRQGEPETLPDDLRDRENAPRHRQHVSHLLLS